MSDAIRNIGTTLEFTDAVSPSGVVAELTSISSISMSRDTIDVTNYDSTDGVREFISGLVDAGEISLAGNFLSSDAGQDYLKAAFDDGDVETVVITLSDSSYWTAECIVTKYECAPGEVGGKVGFSSSLKLTGVPVFTP